MPHCFSRAAQGDDKDPVSDQWLEAFVIVDGDGKPVGPIQDDDAVSGQSFLVNQ